VHSGRDQIRVLDGDAMSLVSDGVNALRERGALFPCYPHYQAGFGPYSNLMLCNIMAGRAHQSIRRSRTGAGSGTERLLPICWSEAEAQ